MVGSFIASKTRNAAAPDHSAATVAIAAPCRPSPEGGREGDVSHENGEAYVQLT